MIAPIVCFFWLGFGLVVGAVAFAFKLASELLDPLKRLGVLRYFAQHWPEDYRRAMPPEARPHLEPIRFGTCRVCHFPWAMNGANLEEHEIFDDRGIQGRCGGSGKAPKP
jgi:hypothetical protein